MVVKQVAFKSDFMETLREKSTRLSRDVYDKYDAYFRASRKAMKNKGDGALQKDAEIKKQEWLDAIEARKRG